MNARDAARILIIDGNRDTTQYYRLFLEVQGDEMVTFLLVSTKQEEIERWHPDLIVFDLLVDFKQEQHTWELIRQLKASPLLASIPLLICTVAFILPGFLIYVREQQVAFLFKPLDMKVLSHHIYTLLTST